MAADGATAVSGRVLTLDGRPLPGVTLDHRRRRQHRERSDGPVLAVAQDRRLPTAASFRFMASTASRPGRQYGFYEYGFTVPAGQTTVLPFTIWMPKLDTRHAVAIPSPTTREVVITTPYIPGLELHLPPKTTLRGEDGKPVTEVSLTPIPVDRPPFPAREERGLCSAVFHRATGWHLHSDDRQWPVRRMARVPELSAGGAWSARAVLPLRPGRQGLVCVRDRADWCRWPQGIPDPVDAVLCVDRCDVLDRELAAAEGASAGETASRKAIRSISARGY